MTDGWLSSNFGMRTDPFTGRLAMHRGVDFAGKMGSPVVAAAAGVVVSSGPRYGYGNLVEVDHGKGCITRYAHNLQNLVRAGQSVRKGQQIARMGSSGRSTGPHVHFEVLRNGQPVNLRGEAQEGGFRIGVLDRGPGIPEADREAVFRPFYRLEASRSVSTGGSGLGLAIVRQLAEAHGWQVSLQARPGGGLEAWLLLAAQQAG